MKFRYTFTALVVETDYPEMDGDLRSQTERRLEEFAERWVNYNNCAVTIEFDTEAGTARVVPVDEL